MSLLQKNNIVTDLRIRKEHFTFAQEFGDVMFLGLQKSNKVCRSSILCITNQPTSQ